MKIAIVGATGFVGPHVVTEALNRGHEVTAFARNPEKLDISHERLTKQAVDVYDTEILAQLLVGQMLKSAHLTRAGQILTCTTTF